MDKKSSAKDSFNDDKEYIKNKKDNKINDSKALLKWINFARKNYVFGFDHLNPMEIPSMGTSLRGIAVGFDKLLSWTPPKSLLNSDNYQSCDLQLQLSLSMYDLKKSCFFGSTWMSMPAILPKKRNGLMRIDMNIVDILYLLTRITDVSCVLVAELIVSLVNESDMTIAQYGCGWTLLNAFAPLNSTEELNEAQFLTCPLYLGSPRDLMFNQENVSFLSQLQQMPDCLLRYKLYNHSKLLKIKRLVPENSLLGRFDVIPGLVGQAVVLPGQTKSKVVSCIGVKEILDEKSGAMIIPNTPDVEIPLSLNISELIVHINDRDNFELRLIRRINDELLLSNPSEVNIVVRNLKIGVHNGHNVLTGEWNVYKLVDDPEDSNKLKLKKPNFELNGYTLNEFMSIFSIIEYEIEAPVIRLKDNNSKIFNNSYMRSGKTIIRILVGVGTLIPYDGQISIWDNPAASTKHGDISFVYLPLIKYDNSEVVCNNCVFANDLLNDIMITDVLDGNDSKVKENSIQFNVLKRYDDNRISSGSHSIISDEAKDIKPVEKIIESTLPILKDDFDNYSISESIVEGDSDTSSIRLDLMNYTSNSRYANPMMTTYKSLKQGERNLMTNSMQIKIADTVAPRKDSDQILLSTKKVNYVEPMKSATRPISRADRSKLDRYGYVNENTFKDISFKGDNINSSQINHYNISLEIADNLKLCDITIQFAGIKFATNTTLLPRSIYCTYQFYNCKTTKTEPMKILLSQPNQSCILVKDDHRNREDPPLAMRYMIDLEENKQDLLLFPYHLLESQMTIDIWDHDSLLHVGSCFVPLKPLLRQNEPLVKSMLEYDIFKLSKSESTIVIFENNITKGEIIGSLNVIMTHIGRDSQIKRKVNNNDTEILNLYSLNSLSRPKHSNSTNRPSMIIRAKPLSESTPELSNIIEDIRKQSITTMKSLSNSRGVAGSMTLTYDDINVIFKRFKGKVKGTIQYTGPLQQLLDVPNLETSLQILIKLFNKLGESNFRKELMHYMDINNTISNQNLLDFFNSLLNNYGIIQRGESILLSNYFCLPNSTISLPDLFSKINVEIDRSDYTKAMKYLKQVIDNDLMRGIDVMSILNESDINGNGYISIDNFRVCLEKLLSNKSNYISIITRHYTKNKNKEISLVDLCNYLNIPYEENITKTLSNYLTRNVEIINQYLSNHPDLYTKLLSFNEFERFINSIISLRSEFKSKHLLNILHKIDVKSSKLVSLSSFMSHFSLEKQIKIPVKSNFVNKSEDEVMNEMIDILINKVKLLDISIDSIFKYFDLNGDGSITINELVISLKKINIFNHINNWERHIHDIIKSKFQLTDGSISLNDFYNYIGISNYIPDIIQKITKIFSLAIDKGLKIEDIFNILDTNHNQSIDFKELTDGLKQIGTFNELNASDIDMLIKTFNANNSASSSETTISVNEFISYFEERINKYKLNQMIKHFHTLIVKSIDKGLKPDQLFDFFDKDHSNTITVEELISGLTNVPYFKDISNDNIIKIVKFIDTDRSGNISKEEFCNFCNLEYIDTTSHTNKNSSNDDINNKELIRNERYSKEVEESKSDFNINGYIKSFFNDLSKNYSNGVDELVSKLDSDGDGIIHRSLFEKYLDKHDFYNNKNIQEFEVSKVIDSLSLPNNHNNVDVIQLLHYLKSDFDNINSFKPLNYDVIDEQASIYPSESYEFSTYPDVKAVEMKLRKIGQYISTKGIDIDALFRSKDQHLNGYIQRTEFIEILSLLGIQLIDYSTIQSNIYNYQHLQLDQIQKIKGKLTNGLSIATSKLGRLSNLINNNDYSSNPIKGQYETMNILQTYRQNYKKDLIQRVLSQSLAKDIDIYPSMGRMMFFELPFSNPFHSEERFIISIDDPELRLLVNYDEWITCRKLTRPCYGELGDFTPEMDMFDIDQSGIIQVSLLSLENIQIPFSYISFHQYFNDDNNIIKTINIRIISGSYGHIVSVVHLRIHPQRSIINRTLHLYEAENNTCKHVIMYVSENKNIQPIKNQETTKFISCIDMSNGSSENSTRVLIEWSRSEDWNVNAHKLILKYKCPKYPDLGKFYILVYDDPYQIKLVETWEIYIHTCQRIDTVGSFGGVSKIELLVKGDRFNRRLKAFTTLESNQSISFNPKNIFNLIPGSYSKISAEILNKTFGTRKDIINLVDVDSNELVSSWIVNITVNPPIEDISQTYEIALSSGEVLAKKILFRNNWNVPRQLRVVSSDTAVLISRDEVLTIDGLKDIYLRLRFHPLNDLINVVYLFIIDEDGNCEESFKFNISYR